MMGWAIVGGLLATMWMVDAIRLRTRARRLRSLSPSSEPISDDHVFLVRPGVVLDEATRRAASAHARDHQLDVLDLVSPRMASWRAMILLFTIDPGTWRKDRLGRGNGVGDAVLVRTSILERCSTPPEPKDAIALIELMRTLKSYAPTTTDLVLAPGLRSPGLMLTERRLLLRSLFGDAVAPVLLLQLTLLALALVFAPLWGFVALAALHLQVLVITLGTPLSPADRFRHVLARVLVDLASTVGRAAPPGRPAITVAGLRPVYRTLLAGGTDRFFDPARKDCPLCGSDALGEVGKFDDHYQRKPGTFILARCGGCGLIFQNPRLSVEGLSFYYRDFYDGLGAELLGVVFANAKREYRARARMVAAQATPGRWLDVGAGHGHFCCAAREFFPGTRFEGLDLSESIDDAVRRRWIDRGIRGLFPEEAPKLAAAGERYDVVSMSHYLEHTLEPRAEIGAAAQVLDPGGLLMVEVPDPESRLGRWFGRGWVPWFQPQHLNFLTVENMRQVLVEHGFEPLVWHRGEAHIPAEFTWLTFVTINRIARVSDVPWEPEVGLATRIGRRIVWALAMPLIGLAWATDVALAPLFRRKGWSNTYRVLARRLG